MAERLGLGPEVRELKLGPTFTSDRGTAFHTLKYDFKPASVDVSKMATVDVGTNNTMTVTVPHLDGAGIPHTIFKGSQRPYSKECVLIIDRATGEITLEKLSSNIQVKKTRVEQRNNTSSGSSNLPQSNNSNLRPTTPVENKKSPPHGRNTSRTKVASGKKREPTVQLHPVPKQQPSPLRVSPYHGKSPPTINNNSSPGQSSSITNLGSSSLASLPMIGGADFDDFLASPVPSTNSVSTAVPSHQQPSSSSSLVNSTASNSVTNKITEPKDSKIRDLSESSSSSSSSDSSDSDSDVENIPNPMAINGHTNGSITSPVLNMPANFLNEDLQLSESESDSD